MTSKLPPSFDPRSVAVTAVDHHLPKLVPAQWQPDAIASRFLNVQPWTPEFVAEPRFSSRRMVAASVLVPLVMRAQMTVLLTQRTAHLSTHSGQIAFPGGKVDADDADGFATALREAEEEIGLGPEFIQVMGALPTYTTGSGFVVTPVIAFVREGFTVRPNPEEVSDVFEVPMEFLMDPSNHRRHTLEWAGSRREWLSMPYPDSAGERFIWGATAGMLRNLYQFLRTSPV